MWNFEIEVLISSFSDKCIMTKYGKIQSLLFPGSFFMSIFFWVYFYRVFYLQNGLFTKYKKLFKMNKLCTTISLRTKYKRKIWNIYMIYKWSIKCYNININISHVDIIYLTIYLKWKGQKIATIAFK